MLYASDRLVLLVAGGGGFFDGGTTSATTQVPQYFMEIYSVRSISGFANSWGNAGRTKRTRGLASKLDDLSLSRGWALQVQ